MDDAAQLEEYSYYLGVFEALGIALIFLTLWYHSTFANYPYRVATWIAVGAALFIPLNFSPKHWLLGRTTKPPISLKAKKAGLVVSLVVYIVSASFLMMWGGGRASSAANLLMLTMSLSVYVAKTSRMKLVIAMLALACYIAASMCWFDSAAGVMRYEISWGVLADCAVVLFVVFVSGVTSREIAIRQRASAAQETPTR